MNQVNRKGSSLVIPTTLHCSGSSLGRKPLNRLGQGFGCRRKKPTVDGVLGLLGRFACRKSRVGIRHYDVSERCLCHLPVVPKLLTWHGLLDHI
jgi:hypothetical protein